MTNWYQLGDDDVANPYLIIVTICFVTHRTVFVFKKQLIAWVAQRVVSSPLARGSCPWRLASAALAYHTIRAQPSPWCVCIDIDWIKLTCVLEVCYMPTEVSGIYEPVGVPFNGGTRQNVWNPRSHASQNNSFSSLPGSLHVSHTLQCIHRHPYDFIFSTKDKYKITLSLINSSIQYE